MSSQRCDPLTDPDLRPALADLVEDHRARLEAERNAATWKEARAGLALLEAAARDFRLGLSLINDPATLGALRINRGLPLAACLDMLEVAAGEAASAQRRLDGFAGQAGKGGARSIVGATGATARWRLVVACVELIERHGLPGGISGTSTGTLSRMAHAVHAAAVAGDDSVPVALLAPIRGIAQIVRERRVALEVLASLPEEDERYGLLLSEVADLTARLREGRPL